MERLSDGLNAVKAYLSIEKARFGESLTVRYEAELDDKLGYSKYDYKNKETDNRRNGYSRKTVKTSVGAVEIAVPRDRNGEFEPQIIKKNETSLAGDIEKKILSLYAKGMTTSDISAHIQDIYVLEVSDSLVSRITDKILPVVREWQQRLPESVYAVVYMDAIHYHVRCEGRFVKGDGLYRHRRWHQKSTRHVCRGERERKVLAFYPERA